MYYDVTFFDNIYDEDATEACATRVFDAANCLEALAMGVADCHDDDEGVIKKVESQDAYMYAVAKRHGGEWRVSVYTADNYVLTGQMRP